MIRKLIAALAAVLCTLPAWAQSAPAEAYPGTNPVTVVIGYPPGGGTDIVGRIVLARVSVATGWRIVVLNVPGATGMIGTRRVSEAAPDGYTLLLGHTAPNAINPGDYTTPRQPIDWNLAPVAMVAQAPALLLARPETGIRDYAGFVAWAKGGKVPRAYGSDGIGSQAHLLMHGLLRSVGAPGPAVHVPYKGGAPALQALMAGDVPVAFSPAPVALGHVGSGRFVVVAQTGAERLQALPAVPTLREVGGPELPALFWGMFAPAGVPPAVTAAWTRALAEAVADPAVREQLARLGYTPAFMSPAIFGNALASERRTYETFSVGVSE